MADIMKGNEKVSHFCLSHINTNKASVWLVAFKSNGYGELWSEE